jgi:regulatory protein YycH of two-component signal transduction system YycFG
MSGQGRALCNPHAKLSDLQKIYTNTKQGQLYPNKTSHLCNYNVFLLKLKEKKLDRALLKSGSLVRSEKLLRTIIKKNRIC